MTLFVGIDPGHPTFHFVVCDITNHAPSEPKITLHEHHHVSYNMDDPNSLQDAKSKVIFTPRLRYFNSHAVKEQKLTLVIEAPGFRPYQSASAQSKAREFYRIVQQWCATTNVNFIYTAPAEWKQALRLTSNKLSSIRLATRLSPAHGPIFCDTRQGHDLAEAFLLCFWAWVKLGKPTD